jgi:tetratricopeptide (TPR) repeat protein
MHIGYFGANLAARQLEVGDLDAALKSVDRGLAASVVVPGPASGLYAFSHHVRGQILLAARKGEAALAQLNTAIEKLRGADDRSSRRLADAQAERALAFAYTGRVDQALVDLRALSTANASLHILGIVQRLSGAFADALDSETKALASLPPGPKANRARSAVLTGLGLTQIERGEWEPAAASLNEALALSRILERRPVPDHADILIGLGRVALAHQRPGDALPWLEEADRFWRQFDRQSRWSGEASLWLGRAYAALDRDADATPALARARAILSRSAIPSDSRLARLAAGRR